MLHIILFKSNYFLAVSLPNEKYQLFFNFCSNEH